jgi:tetratricopeptide (TPR) repeat protein
VKSEELKEMIAQGLASSHNNYALLLINMKRYEEAESHFRESLRINSEFRQAHNNYALLLINMKRYEEAEFHYKESLRINVLSQVSKLDFIIVISYNPSPERFHRIADPIPSDHHLYILLVNVSEKGSSFGKSGIFGIIDDIYKGDLI